MKGIWSSIILPAIFLTVVLGACLSPPDSSTDLSSDPARIDRQGAIPSNAVKMGPENDPSPPVVLANDFEQPVPVPGAVNTAGVEDAVFITPDGNTMYFFFTPDVDIPVEKQILDGVTGLYVSHLIEGNWLEAERIILQEPGKLALDGCVFESADRLWFCSARENYTGIHWFSAEYLDDGWTNWQNTDFSTAYEVGELHFTSDYSTLYFGSDMPGGKGGLDIWQAAHKRGALQEPINIAAVNTTGDEGWPALSPTGDELWITRDYGVWRSTRFNGEWQEAQLIVSPLAGEASIDQAGNLYFVHHYFVDGTMIEADIYVAYRK